MSDLFQFIQRIPLHRNDSRKRICICAQDYGFGPMSLLSQAILGVAQYLDIYAIGTDKQIEYFRKNGIRIRKKVRYQDLINGRYKFSAVISSFDPTSIFLAWYGNTPSIYIDNLMWFWKVNPKIIRISYELLIHSKNSDSQSLFDIIQTINGRGPHTAIVLAHMFASRSLIQRFGHMVTLKLLEQYKCKIRLFGALVPQKAVINKHKNITPLVYVQLGGMRNIGTTELFTRQYIEIICTILNAINEKDRYMVICKVNPSFLPPKKKYPHVQVISTISFQMHMDYIRQCDYLIIHPGANSIYESTYYHKQIFLLPEQATSHTPNLRTLFRSGFSCPSVNFFSYWKNILEDPQYLAQGMNELYSNTAEKNKLSDKIRKFLETEELYRTIHKRYLVVKKLLGDYNGTETMQKEVQNFIFDTRS